MHSNPFNFLRFFIGITCAIAMPILFCACDGMVQDVDIKLANSAPVLALSASINTEGGVLDVSFTEARSLGMYKNSGASEVARIVRHGTITLYEDGVEMYTKHSDGDGFDMSLRQASYSTFSLTDGVGNANGYRLIETNFPFKSGSTYTIKLNIDGYPEATASVVMPSSPDVNSVALDTTKMLICYNVEPIQTRGSSIQLLPENLDKIYYPLNLRITDATSRKDFYLFQMRVHHEGNYDGWQTAPIATSNQVLIQDCPDMGDLFDMDIGNPDDVDAPDAYIFDRILVSDFAFANATKNIDLLVNHQTLWRNYSFGGGRFTFCNGLELLVSHVSTEVFEQYRTLLLNAEGVGFFTEPVPLYSNVSNGYGCFAAINTTRINLLK